MTFQLQLNKLSVFLKHCNLPLLIGSCFNKMSEKRLKERKTVS